MLKLFSAHLKPKSRSQPISRLLRFRLLALTEDKLQGGGLKHLARRPSLGRKDQRHLGVYVVVCAFHALATVLCLCNSYLDGS